MSTNKRHHRPDHPRARFSASLWARAALWPAVIAAVVPLTSCGAGDDAVPTGTFIDSPVAGLDVQSSSGARQTNAAGQYSYAPGETLSFAIGNLALGSATAAPVLTPLSITSGAASAADPRVSNKLILLQTLDADGDLNNGIQITDAIRGIVSSNAAAINFDQPSTAFRTSLAGLMTALNTAKVFTSADPRARTVRATAAAQEHFARSTSARQVVNTTGGQLSGFEANASTWQFLGIPYAKPPLGDLRWRPPQAPDAWRGVRQAVAWSNQSAQNPTMESIGEGGMSEDSLYLNVTAPKNARNLPVMVWFHGGAFAILSGNTKQYNNPEGVASKGVVLVTVNHRLGAFGYMAHPLLSAESGYGGSGNYGQMDLVMALKWVQSNIAQFGGDPGNVTIFGQSGGGGKTYSLMNSPQARGLFHKAIVQSGASPITALADRTADRAASLAAGEAIGTAMFSRLGITTLAQARALPWTAFAQADLAASIPREIYRPNVDYYYLPKTYAENLADGMPSDVPLMVGATSGDYASLRSGLPTFMAQRTASYASNQFVYRFSRVPDGWAAMGLLSGHGGEVPYLFNYPMGMVSNYNLNLVLIGGSTKPPIADLNGNGITGTAGDTADIYTSMAWGASDTATVDTVMSMWTQFAKTGNPSVSGFAWPPYTLAGDQYVEIGPGSSPSVKTGLATAFP